MPPIEVSEEINRFVKEEEVNGLVLGQVSLVLKALTDSAIEDEDVSNNKCPSNY